MIVDKSGLLEMLIPSEDQVATWGRDGIFISVPESKGRFDPETQIGTDSIDLRISNEAYIMNNEYEYINTLSEKSFTNYFKKVPLYMYSGYDLKPGEILFVSTIERIHLLGNLSGRVTGRSSFARMGLAIHCTQDKFSSGINSVVCLQLINHSNNVLKIFPYQKLAQIIIQKTGTVSNPYTQGNYAHETTFTLPVVSDKDREQYSDSERMLIKQNVPKKKNFIQRYKPRKEFRALYQGIFNIMVSLGVTVVSLFGASVMVICTCIGLNLFLIILNLYFYRDSQLDD